MNPTAKFLMLTAASLLLASAAGAVTKNSQTFEGWLVECASEGEVKNCVMAQVLVNQKTKQRVASMGLRKLKGETAKLGLQVPLGVDLSAGISLALEGTKAVKIAYRTCVQNGCVGEFELTEAWLKAFSSDGELTLTVSSLTGETVPFKIALKGFAQAHAYFTAEAP